MIRRGLLLIGLVALVLPASAQAGTTIVAQDGAADYPYQRWVEKANAPLPEGVFTLTEGPTSGYIEPGSISVRVRQPDRLWVRSDFYYALGQQFDLIEMTTEDRTAFLEFLGRPGALWDDPAAESGESVLPIYGVFANTYAVCALRVWRRGELVPRLEGPFVFGRKRQQAACRLIEGYSGV